MPPPRAPARVGSLPHLGLHINIPSNPATPTDDKPASAKSSHLSQDESQEEHAPPVTPATALTVLPLHAAVAAGNVAAVREWLDARVPAGDDAGKKPVLGEATSTPEWPPRPVRDILGPSSESREPWAAKTSPGMLGDAPVPGDVPGDGGVPEHPRGRLRGPRLPGLATGAEDVPDRPRRPLWRAGRLAEHGLLPCVVPGGDARVQPLAHRRDVSRGDRGVQREHGERCGRGHGRGVFLLALVLRQVRALGAGGLVIRRRRGVRRDVDVQAEVRQASHARGGARRRHGARIPRGRRGDRQRRCFFFMLRDVGHDTVRGGIDGRAHRGRGVVRVHRGRIRCLLGRSTRIVQRAQLGHALRRAALRARFCGHARRVRLVVARHRPTRVSTTARPPLPPRRATSEA